MNRKAPYGLIVVVTAFFALSMVGSTQSRPAAFTTPADPPPASAKSADAQQPAGFPHLPALLAPQTDSFTWVRSTIDTAGSTGTYASAGVDPELGTIYISYYDSTNGDRAWRSKSRRAGTAAPAMAGCAPPSITTATTGGVTARLPSVVGALQRQWELSC